VIGTPSTVICLTPVKDEAWILDRFLRCAALWADHILVADQGSTDGSRDIARLHPKVTLIDNPAPSYNEVARQKLLLAAARAIPAKGPRVLIALDADEALTANWKESGEWESVCSAVPGTVITFNWVNIWPDLKSCWMQPENIPMGFVDDGSDHSGLAIHSTRVPKPFGAPELNLRETKVLHYQYTDWQRMMSKQRWYQCWERINQPHRRAANVYRQYHFMHGIVSSQLCPVRSEWLASYLYAGIEMTSVNRQSQYRWDLEILDLLEKHGADFFRRVNIWEVDWATLSTSLGRDGKKLVDPQSYLDKWILDWLKSTQGHYTLPWTRLCQWLLRFVGW
jgi:hypothetical protein